MVFKAYKYLIGYLPNIKKLTFKILPHLNHHRNNTSIIRRKYITLSILHITRKHLRKTIPPQQSLKPLR